MANILEKLFTAGGNIIAARNQEKATRRAAKDQQNLIKSLDWTPTTTAELAPAYQRSQSPVARSYLESFLMGNNPDAVMPGEVNAAYKRQQAQASQNAMFGTPEQRLAQQNAYRQTTPWALSGQPGAAGTKSTSNPLKRAQLRQEESQKQGMHALERPRAVEAGLDADLYAKLEKEGVVKGKYDKGNYNWLARENPEVIRSLAETGNYDALRTILGFTDVDRERGPSSNDSYFKQQWIKRLYAAEAEVKREKKRLKDIEDAEV